MATAEDLSGSATWNEYPNDPNLLRYLKLGRRHTLGAAHNHMLMAPSDLGHVREASECSSQTSNEISTDTATATPSFEPRTLLSALSSGPTEAQHLQSGSSPSSRLALLQPQLRSRMGRRASDGGPYAAVFRLYLEKRNPQLAQINSRGSLHEATTLSSSSVKHLLQDKRTQEIQCGKPPAQSKEWLHYKDQMLQQKQLTSAVYNPASPESMVPVQLNHLSGITNSIGDDTSHTRLRAQVQPFQTYTPQQIQEQLQHLHIQQHTESESAMHTEVAALLQQPLIQKPLTGADAQSLQAVRETSPTKDSSSSILHHLLSQSPKSVVPKSVVPNTIVQSNPFSHNHTRRTSFPKNVTGPLAAQLGHQPQDNCPPSELYAMMGNVAAGSNHEVSSFPVNIQTREGSPTKGMGRRSPIHDHQMASIAEDTSEITTLPSGTLATSSTPETSNGVERQNKRYSVVPSVPTGTSLSVHIDEPDSQVSESSGTHGSLRYSNYFVREHINHVNTSPIIPTTLNHLPGTHQILSHISTILNSNRMQHYQSGDGFIVEHDGVKLHIICNPSYLNMIHMQFVAGDLTQYQTLSSHLAALLQITD
jgi:hypothetical protein